MTWAYLIMAGLFEVVGVIGIKRVSQSNNFTNNAILIGGFVISFSLLRLALLDLELSTAYAVWTGIGTLGSTAIGILFYREPRTLMRLLCIIGIIGTIIALRFLS